MVLTQGPQGQVGGGGLPKHLIKGWHLLSLVPFYSHHLLAGPDFLGFDADCMSFFWAFAPPLCHLFSFKKKNYFSPYFHCEIGSDLTIFIWLISLPKLGIRISIHSFLVRVSIEVVVLALQHGNLLKHAYKKR